MDTIINNNITEDILDKSALNGKRILVCGKGGSGKSTVITLLANTLSKLKYEVVVLDGDASNPGGLARLLFGLKEGVKPLIDFFGGRGKVECPIDDPSILTRLNDDVPITKKLINLSEIPQKYYVQRNGITLFQVGKINQPYEGCDGPMSKVTRDFMVKGNVTTLIDMEAGIEHYGRGIEKNVDLVIVVVDPTFESILIAQKVAILCQKMGIENYGAIVNKILWADAEQYVKQELFERGLNVYGLVKYDKGLFESGLMGSSINIGAAINGVKKIVSNIIKDVKEERVRFKYENII
jgi:CO dehydrogenase maturation factor